MNFHIKDWLPTHITLKVGPKLMTSLSTQFVFKCWASMLSKHIPQSTANRQTLFISDNHHTQLHPQLTVQNIMYMCDILLYRLCMQWTSTIHEMIVKRRFLRCLEQGFSKRSNKSDFSYLRQAATHITLKVGTKLVTTLSQFLFECWVALLRVYYSQQANKYLSPTTTTPIFIIS